MPAHTFAHIMLALCSFRPDPGDSSLPVVPMAHDAPEEDPAGVFPWSNVIWRQARGGDCPFQLRPPGAKPAKAGALTDGDVVAISGFAQEFWRADKGDRAELLKKTSDTQAQGRDAWTAYIKHAADKVWKLNADIDRLLDEQASGLDDLMAAFDVVSA
jgi:hypothetical protein